jgi:ATP-binding cassette, subfamily F, member 3
MGIININGLSFHYTGEMILDGISFELEKNDKVGLIGLNGSGKTTLLKLINSELKPVSGSISIPKDIKMGYLSQEETVSADRTVYEEVLEAFRDLILIEEKINGLSGKIAQAMDEETLRSLVLSQSVLNDSFLASGGLTYENRTKAVLKGLGFTDEQLTLQASKLSGGQKTRIVLARLLLQKPDVLLLDEPTNHLDLGSIAWLEDFLNGYKNLVIIISHDRYFLDMVTNKTAEIENKSIVIYKGNYSESRKQKEAYLLSYRNASKKQGSEIKHLKEVITTLKRFNREKSVKRARSFEKKLDKISGMETPNKKEKRIRLEFNGRTAGSKDVLQVSGLSKRYGDVILFDDLSFSVYRNDRFFVLGPNGAGKSTLLKIITEKTDPDSGQCRIGINIRYGYYDQEHIFDEPENTLFDEIYDEFPHLNKTQVQNALAGMLFTGADSEKKISSLSGGEKGRLALLKLMLSSPDLMILDEPTNHLDIYSREQLETALLGYDGTLLAVSHDRFFINKLADRILYLNKGSSTLFKGSYEEFISGSVNSSVGPQGSSNRTSDTKAAFLEVKKRQAIIRKTESDIQKLNGSIETNDILLNEIENDIIEANNKNDYEALLILTKRKDSVEIDCIHAMEELHELEIKLKEITG